MRTPLTLSMLLVLAACARASAEDEVDLGEPVEAICPGPTGWSPSATAFVERTEAWGLIGVLGVRLEAVDFDGDGWPDLVVHLGGNDIEDLSTPETHKSWLLRNTGGTGFEDVTQSSGFRRLRGGGEPTQGRPGSVVAWADVDNDGDLDAYTGVGDPDGEIGQTSEIMLNNGDGTFSVGPPGSELRVTVGDNPSGASFVDIDRDGNVDLWLTQNSAGGQPLQDRLYKGDGTGSFTDITAAAGLITKPWQSLADLDNALAHTNGWAGHACDLNGDGDAELLSASYGRAPDHLWQADGDGTFTNRSAASGYAYDARMDWSDNESARCYCKLNPTAVDCAGVPAPQYIACNAATDAFRWNHANDRNRFRLGGNSACTTCGDVDNDGNIDLLTGSIVHWDVGSSSDAAELLFNDGKSDVAFARPGREATGLTRERTMVAWNDGDMTNTLLDFDNDGWVDVYIGSSDYEGARGHLYHQDSPRRFTEVDPGVGIDHNRSHGVAVADFDRDGDLDVVVGHSRSRCGGTEDCYPTQQIRLFENQLGGNYLQVTLAGAPGTNRSAVGARVTVETDETTQTREVEGGHGHFGAQDDHTLHFGLGPACGATVTVRWPDADLSTESFDLVAGYRYVVTQGGAAEAVR